MRPRIGVTTSVGGSQKPRNKRYIEAVQRAGGEPEWIEPRDVVEAGGPAALVATLDGLLLSGGRDIHPADYGQTLRENLGVEVDAERYRAELPLAREALAKDLPILGICGGMQALTVATGGTLHQDLSLVAIDGAVHKKNGAQRPRHQVTLTPESRLMEIIQASPIEVVSSHHQVIERPGRGFVVVARASDGAIEAVEAPAHRFVIGVQWHPDLMADDERQRRLFEAFVQSASALPARP